MAGQPNFFIVGAPKCGTTALYEYLRAHPSIFMPRYKEPHYFAEDLGAYRLISNADAYAGIFAAARRHHVRVGEASVYYLRSSQAIPRIRAFAPDARIIAMFRNPVDMLHALHSQLLYVGEETVGDFERAWRLQSRRARGLDVPPRCRDPFLLQFAHLGRLGVQARRLLDVFPAEQVKLILYEDFSASPRTVYDEVIEFLGVTHDGRTEFPRVNGSKRARVAWVKGLLRKPPPSLRKAVRACKRTLGAERLGALKSQLVRLNTINRDRAPLSVEFRSELVETFRDDVALLSGLVRRQLDWR